MSRSHLILAERIGIEVICSHGHELPNNCCLPWPATTAPFPARCARAAPNPAVMPGLLITGLEKEERCRAMTAA